LIVVLSILKFVFFSVGTPILEIIDNVVCEHKSDSQNYSDSIPDDKVIDCNLLTEILATSYTNSVEPKGNN